jgi:hypothetical protein
MHTYHPKSALRYAGLGLIFCLPAAGEASP